MGRSQSNLIRMRQIQIVDAAHQRLEPLFLSQCAGERRHQRGLPGALHAIETDEEGLLWVRGLVRRQLGEDEGDAVWGFVVYDLGSGVLR
jgi:hypothetical protein